MEKTPNQNEQQPIDSENQDAAANKPMSGDRPDQGTLPTNDHYDPQGKPMPTSACFRLLTTLAQNTKIRYWLNHPKRLRV
jgi:hypothetical protein